jgi:hypothetical protein
MSILVLTAGGSIGAVANTHPQSPPQCVTMPANGEDLVCKALAQPRFSFAKTRCVSLEQRDSKQIDERYLENMVGLIVAAPESGVLITYGTDRILQAAGYFYSQSSARPALRNKVIVLEFSLKQLIDFTMLSEGRPQPRSGIYIVLCDYESPETENGAWLPHLYPYQPDHYEKVFVSDGRYNRLRQT